MILLFQNQKIVLPVNIYRIKKNLIKATANKLII